MFGQNHEIIVSSCLIRAFSGSKTCLSFTEFQKLWRSVPVDSIDEEKIEEYLKKQGISSMQETGPKKAVSVPCFPIYLIIIVASQIKINLPRCISLEIKTLKFVLCLSSILICTNRVSVLPAVTRSKEEKAKRAEEETLQDPQQPFGRRPGGLFRWCSCEEMKLFGSLFQM